MNFGNGFNLSQNFIPVFSRENYDFWSIKMRTLFISQDLWEVVENGYAEADKVAEMRDLRKKDVKALIIL